jgi:hypothetical protein
LLSRMTLVKLVNVYPGLIESADGLPMIGASDTHARQLTRMFCLAHSTAKDRAICLTAASASLALFPGLTQ